MISFASLCVYSFPSCKALAAHRRVWSSGVEPMPPKENSTGLGWDAINLMVWMIRAGSSSMMNEPVSLCPFFTKACVTKSKCASVRLRLSISVPMMRVKNVGLIVEMFNLCMLNLVAF